MSTAVGRDAEFGVGGRAEGERRHEVREERGAR